jgi:hypothetical protein
MGLVVTKDNGFRCMGKDALDLVGQPESIPVKHDVVGENRP